MAGSRLGGDSRLERGIAGDVLAGPQMLSTSPGGRQRCHGFGIGQLAGDGSMETDKKKGDYTFTYSTTLPWLIWNEYHNANVEPDPTMYLPPAS